MKYIRTKDEIFDIDNYLIENATKKCFHGIIVGSYEDFEDIEIIKQADTIEELCDWFLTIVNGRIHTYGVDFEYAKCHLFLFKKCESVEIKGAIETDKGLIYVAKMNDKGTLELL